MNYAKVETLTEKVLTINLRNTKRKKKSQKMWENVKIMFGIMCLSLLHLTNLVSTQELSGTGGA